MRLLVVGDQPSHTREQSIPAEVFLILGLHTADHVNAQPPTVTSKDTATAQVLGLVPHLPRCPCGQAPLGRGRTY